MPFTSWNELNAFVQKNYGKFEAFGDGMVRFDFKHKDGTTPFGMRRAVLPHGSDWVVFVVKVGSLNEIQPAMALFANFLMPIGALSVVEDMVMLTQKLPVEGLTEAHVQQTLDGLVQELEISRSKLLTKSPGTTASQGYLAD